MDMTTSRIVRSSPLPIYIQLADILRDRIAREHVAGDLLPSEAALCETHGISRTAVRDALRLLADEGLVRKEKGRGTFVTGNRIAEIVIQDVRGFVEEMASQGRTVATKIVEFAQVEAAPDVAEALGLSAGDPVVRLHRVRLLEGTPVLVAVTTLPHTRFATLLQRDLEHASLYDVLARDFDVHPVGGPRRIEARAADAVTAELLEVKAGAPLLVLTARNDDADGVPVEHFVAHYVASRVVFDFSVRTDRDGHHATLGLSADGGHA